MKINSTTICLSAVLMAAAAAVPAVERAEGSHPAPGMVERPGVKKVEAPEIRAGTTVIAYKLAWQRVDDRRVAERFASAASVMTGKVHGKDSAMGSTTESSMESAKEPDGASDRVSSKAFLPAITGDDVGRWVNVEGAELLVRYEAEFDEVWLLDRERAAIGPSGKDIGSDAIGKAAEELLAALGKAGVLDPRLYQQAVMQVGYEMVGTGSVDKDEIDRGQVAAYRVTYRPRLNGIELANAGVRMGILPSGELYSLRAGGVTPKGEWQDGELKPTAGGGERRVSTDAQALMKRFYAQVPDEVEPSVAWSRVMYAMPEDSNKNQAVVEPKFVVSWSPMVKGESEPVVGRRIIQAWSLTDLEAAPVRYDPPPRAHESGKVTRDAGNG